MTSDALQIEQDGQQLRFIGALDLKHFAQANKAVAAAARKNITIDLSEVTTLDTAGALLLQRATRQHMKLSHLQPQHKALLNLVTRTEAEPLPKVPAVPSFARMLIRLGKVTAGIWPAATEFIAFLGHALMELAKVIRHPSKLRVASITHHIEAIGINAIPIVSLIALIISIVVAYQGQAQLGPLGVQQYTVNLVAISVLREMGVLLTAIIVAGRSGSAFAAEIGAMRIRQETDALRSLGFNPFELLVLPRLIALLVALPLLTLVADIMGLFGGGLISMALMDISMPEYIERARLAAQSHDFYVGMVKAPVFALVIGLVGCLHGLKVSGSAESVGRETTASVVKSIFLVLMLDGLFSIYFDKVGL